MFKIMIGSLLIIFSTSIVSASTSLTGIQTNELQKSEPKTRILSVEEMLSMENVQEDNTRREYPTPDKKDRESTMFLSWENLLKPQNKK